MNRHAFPLEFQKVLVSRESDYTRLAKMMARRGYRVSKQFIGMLALGKRRVPAEQLKRFCEVLELSEVERRRLHVAACMDQGFEVGPL